LGLRRIHDAFGWKANHGSPIPSGLFVSYNSVVQVFVPSTDFAECAACLDTRRLGKQLLECALILNILYDVPKKDGGKRTAWLNHPATLQWKFWPGALACYSDAIADECDRRALRTEALREQIKGFTREGSLPIWWGDEKVHSSHRSRLLQKSPEHYSQFHWKEAKAKDLAEHRYWWAIPDDEGKGYRLERRGKG